MFNKHILPVKTYNIKATGPIKEMENSWQPKDRFRDVLEELLLLYHWSYRHDTVGSVWKYHSLGVSREKNSKQYLRCCHSVQEGQTLSPEGYEKEEEREDTEKHNVYLLFLDEEQRYDRQLKKHAHSRSKIPLCKACQEKFQLSVTQKGVKAAGVWGPTPIPHLQIHIGKESLHKKYNVPHYRLLLLVPQHSLGPRSCYP